MELDAEGFRDDLAGEVIAGRAESTGDEKDIRTDNHFLKGFADRLSIWDSRLPRDAQTHAEELPPKPTAMSVKCVAEKKLSAGV